MRKVVMADRVRVGDYWETGDGSALRVNAIEHDVEGALHFQVGSRVGAEPAWALALPCERVEIRRLKPAAKR